MFLYDVDAIIDEVEKIITTDPLYKDIFNTVYNYTFKHCLLEGTCNEAKAYFTRHDLMKLLLQNCTMDFSKEPLKAANYIIISLLSKMTFDKFLEKFEAARYPCVALSRFNTTGTRFSTGHRLKLILEDPLATNIKNYKLTSVNEILDLMQYFKEEVDGTAVKLYLQFSELGKALKDSNLL